MTVIGQQPSPGKDAVASLLRPRSTPVIMQYLFHLGYPNAIAYYHFAGTQEKNFSP